MAVLKPRPIVEKIKTERQIRREKLALESPREYAIRRTVESYRHRIKKIYPNAVFETEFVLGCTIPQMIEWIESKMEPGMSWENKKDKWQMATYMKLEDLNNPDQFYKFFHYTNMKPVWKKPQGFVTDPTRMSLLDRPGNGL